MQRLAALGWTNELFQSAFEGAPVGMCLVSPEGRFLGVNNAFCLMLERPESELLSLSFLDVTHPEDRDASREWVGKILSGEEVPESLEKRYLRKSGQVLWGIVRSSLLRGDDGAPLVFITHIQDITERKKAEEALRERQERLRVILESTNDGILAVNASSTVVFLNKRFLDLWRIPQTTADGGDNDVLRAFVLDQLVDPDGFLARIEQLWGTPDPAYDTILFKDGRVFERYSVPMMDNGAVNGRLWSFRDITERKRSEEALKESEARYRSIFDYSADGIVIVDPDTAAPIDFNQQACAQLGYSPEEFARLRISDIETLESPERVAAHIRKVIETGYDEFETVHRAKGGDRRDVHVKAQHFLIGGKPVYHCIWRDITDRKAAEAEKEKLQAQLLQAMKMEAVGRLAGGVAHDFNNLLTAINGYCQLLLQKIDADSPLHGDVAEIRRAGERAATLTQQLLAFSRKQMVEPKVVYLDHLVAEMHKMLTRLIGEDIELQAVTGRALGAVKVDPGQFQQILMNLAVNARDAMPDGGKIMIETANADLGEEYCARHPSLKAGRYVTLSVRDTGTGMPEEVRTHVFEPFFTTKKTGSGTGLGLAMAYGIVEQAGGAIEVDSEVGAGTSVRIHLPRVEEEEAAKAKSGDRAMGPLRGAETILLVEDEEILRSLCVRILEQLGYRVLQAGNGAEALAAAQENGGRIDLLLTDVVMPGMNGSELAEQLVLHQPDIKVLFMSGYTDDTISRHGIVDEEVSFIAKPYTPLALAQKVRETLGTA